MYLFKGRMKYIDKIIASGKTVFRYQDIEILLGIANKNTLKKFFERRLKDGFFKTVQKGVFVTQTYDKKELGTKLKKNSYISFETVLIENGIIFQDYANSIFLASDNSLKKSVDNINYKYFKIKNTILLNPLGIQHHKNYMQASAERAICDKLYLSKNYHFDNLDNIRWGHLEEIAQIYNKRVILAVKKLRKDAI